MSTPDGESGSPAAVRRWREPTSLLPLRWGTYRERLLAGLCLIVSGGIATAGSNYASTWLLYLGLGVHVLGWCIVPSAGWRRIVAVAPATLFTLALLAGPRFLVGLVVPYLCWLLVRHRPLIAYPTAVLVLTAAIALGELLRDYRGMLLALSIEFAVMVGSAWIAWLIARGR